MDIRNIAIIAHVDHGKTTLVDAMLRQSGAFRASQQQADRALDSQANSARRGITILAKCTSVVWRDVRIQHVVDTPGHADFGGEVERILSASMVDGPSVLVDAAELMPKAKFCRQQGAASVMPDRRHQQGRSAGRAGDRGPQRIFDLFAAPRRGGGLSSISRPPCSRPGATAGQRPNSMDHLQGSLALVVILEHVPPPRADPQAPFSMLATTLDYDPYLGRVLTGLIHSGWRVNMPVKSLSPRRPRHRAGAADQLRRIYSRARSTADRRGPGGRHHCRRRARADHGRRHDLCARGGPAARRRSDRPAHTGDDLLGQ
jgi:GTP-binding protein